MVLEIFQLLMSDETHLKRLKRLEIYWKFQSPGVTPALPSMSGAFPMLHASCTRPVAPSGGLPLACAAPGAATTTSAPAGGPPLSTCQLAGRRGRAVRALSGSPACVARHWEVIVTPASLYSGLCRGTRASADEHTTQQYEVCCLQCAHRVHTAVGLSPSNRGST